MITPNAIGALYSTDWVDTSSSYGLSQAALDHLRSTLSRDLVGRDDYPDRHTLVWHSESSSADIALASSGGWRVPQNAYLKLFLFADGCPAADITKHVLGEDQINYIDPKTKVDRYYTILDDTAAIVTARIGARKLNGPNPSPQVTDEPVTERRSLIKMILAWFR